MKKSGSPLRVWEERCVYVRAPMRLSSSFFFSWFAIWPLLLFLSVQHFFCLSPSAPPPFFRPFFFFVSSFLLFSLSFFSQTPLCPHHLLAAKHPLHSLTLAASKYICYEVYRGGGARAPCFQLTSCQRARISRRRAVVPPATSKYFRAIFMLNALAIPLALSSLFFSTLCRTHETVKDQQYLATDWLRQWLWPRENECRDGRASMISANYYTYASIL